MSINAGAWSNLLNGILKCAPNFGAQMINDFFHFLLMPFELSMTDNA
ncbi:hypothetical protein [Xanthomonas campestris]|nr:hypothetical protein [Xanthomonas campestris]MCC8688345.1 hypothetical protein [Xanthomonas campestris]